MQLAHGPVVLGKVLFDRAGGDELIVHALDEAALLLVGEAAGDDLERHLRRRRQRSRRQRDVGWVHVRFLDGAAEHLGKAQRRVADQLGDEATRHAIEASRRIDDAALDVVVGNQLLVVAVGFLGAPADELGQPVRPGRQLDIDVGELDLAQDPQLVVGLRDAPLDGAVDVVLRLRLAGVEGMQRVRVVVAEHAGAIGRRRPVLQRQRLDEVIVPAAHLLRRPAPVAIARVQHVVLEVLELAVGCLRSLEVELGVPQEQPLPHVGIHALEAPQRVEGQLVVRARRVGGVDDVKEEVHGSAFRKSCRARRSSSQPMNDR